MLCQITLMFRFMFTMVQVNTTTYSASDLCGPPATDYGWMDPGMIHTTTMDKYAIIIN